MKIIQYVLLGIVLLTALYFRFHLIGKIPGGLYPDEAANGLDINNILKGHIAPFFLRGNGREALFFYFEAASVLMFGRGVWQFHIVSATIGVLSVLGCYLVASRFYNRSVGLMASFFMAVGTWHIVLSRTALRAIQTPLFISFLFYFGARALQAKTKAERYWCAAIAGIFLGGGLYTYIAFRVVPLIIIFVLAIVLLVDWRQKWAWVKEYWGAACTTFVVALVTTLPIDWYFITNPGSFSGRSSQVSVFNPDLNHGHLLATIGTVFFKQVRAYFIDGDTNWRQNISGFPFLSPLISPFFGVCLLALTLITVVVVYKALAKRLSAEELKKKLASVTVVAIFWVMLIPVVATDEGIPHGLRSVGTIPAVYILSAVGVAYAWKKLHELWHHGWMEYLYKLVAVLFFASMAFISYQQYFVYAANVPMVNPGDSVDAFRSDLTRVSSWINAHPNAKLHTYLVLDLYSVQTVDYLTTAAGNPYVIVDPAHAQDLHVSRGDTVLFTGSTVPDAERFLQAHQGRVAIAEEAYNRFGAVELIVVNVTANDPSVSLGANADGSFTVLNFGQRIDWYWEDVSFYPWVIKIWQCSTADCSDAQLVKTNNQNDYLSTADNELVDGTRSDLYFHAVGYDSKGNVIKDYGTIKAPKYVQ